MHIIESVQKMYARHDDLKEETTRYCVMTLYSDTICSQIVFLVRGLQNRLKEFYFRKDISQFFIFVGFLQIHPSNLYNAIVMIHR